MFSRPPSAKERLNQGSRLVVMGQNSRLQSAFGHIKQIFLSLKTAPPFLNNNRRLLKFSEIFSNQPSVNITLNCASRFELLVVQNNTLYSIETYFLRGIYYNVNYLPR